MIYVRVVGVGAQPRAETVVRLTAFVITSSIVRHVSAMCSSDSVGWTKNIRLVSPSNLAMGRVGCLRRATNAFSR